MCWPRVSYSFVLHYLVPLEQQPSQHKHPPKGEREREREREKEQKRERKRERERERERVIMRVIKRKKHPKNLALRATTPPYPPILSRANPWEVVPLHPTPITHAPEMKTPAPSLRGTLAKGGQSPRRFYPPPNCSINGRPQQSS